MKLYHSYDHSVHEMLHSHALNDTGAVLQTRENLPVVLRATYPENRVALTKY